MQRSAAEKNAEISRQEEMRKKLDISGGVGTFASPESGQMAKEKCSLTLTLHTEY